MGRHCRRAALLALLSLPALSHAQKSPGNTLTISTRLIYVDVVVRDDYGRPAQGLTAADFSVKEDGRPQQIVFFQDSDTARPTPSPASPSNTSTTTPSQPGIEFTNVAPASVTDPAANVILLDLLNTPVTDQLYAIRQLIAFCKKLPPGHRFALFLLTNRLHVLQGLTGSSDQLLAAASKLTANDLQLADSRDARMQMADIVTAFAKAIGPDPGGSAGHMRAELDNEQAENLAQRFRTTGDAFAQIARAVSGYPGRKNLLWLAEDFPFGVGAQLQMDRADEALDVRDTNSLVANQQIALYPISLAGLQTEGVGAASNGQGEVSLIGGPTGSASNPQANDTLRDQFTARTSMYYAMNDLAHNTGGEAFHGTNDIAGSIRRAVDDGSQYYTLAYRPSNQKSDGHLRADQHRPRQARLSPQLSPQLPRHTRSRRHARRRPRTRRRPAARHTRRQPAPSPRRSGAGPRQPPRRRRHHA